MADPSAGIAIEDSAPMEQVAATGSERKSLRTWLKNFKEQTSNTIWDKLEQSYPAQPPRNGEVKVAKKTILGEDQHRAKKETTILWQKLHPEPVKYVEGKALSKEPVLLGDLEANDGYAKLLLDASIDYPHAGNAFNQLYPVLGVFVKSEIYNRPEVAKEILGDVKQGDPNVTYKAILNLAQYLSRNRETGKFELGLFHNGGPFEGFLGDKSQIIQVRQTLAGFCSEALYVFNNPKGNYLDSMKDRGYIRESSWESLLTETKNRPQTTNTRKTPVAV